jgi:HD-GYP domain-containing protein (c-di-GMP phosphodiesterase class II)
MHWLTKPIHLIMLCQAVCLAVGLWIHNRVIVSSAQWRAEEETWAEFAAQANPVIPELQKLDISQLIADTSQQQATRGLLESIGSTQQADVLVVDADWRIVSAAPSPNWQASGPWSPGQVVSWEVRGPAPDAAYRPLRGTLLTSGGDHLGLAYPLKNGGGYVVCHRPAVSIPISTDGILAAMPAASMVGFLWTCGLQCIVAHLIFSRVQSEHSRQQTKSGEEALQRMRDLLQTRDAVIFGMAKLAESRDPETGHHLERISAYAEALSSALRRDPRYRNIITPAFIRLIGISSALHDIGKVGVEDAILLKPGKLTKAERFRMQLHTIMGGDCIREIERRLGNCNFLEMAREIALYHHERWDGKGYPTGMSGTEIPLAARIVAIADVYDALSVRRVYKEAFPHEQCVALIRDEAGKQFDPDLVRAFLKIESQFQRIARQFADPSEQSGKEVSGDAVDVAPARPKARRRMTPAEEASLLTTIDQLEALALAVNRK